MHGAEKNEICLNSKFSLRGGSSNTIIVIGTLQNHGHGD